MQIKIKKLHPEAKVPAYAHPGDAGLDLCTTEDIVVPAGGRANIPTGLALAIPDGYVGLVWDKSGLAFKSGLTSLSGVLDAGYRGELRLVLLNTTDTDYHFVAGDKVAQLLIQPIVRAEIEEVSDLPASRRGIGGFGSTGR
ncbi:MAG: dUTP diphosphatase [Candidatus Paceibacterota bacterium]